MGLLYGILQRILSFEIKRFILGLSAPVTDGVPVVFCRGAYMAFVEGFT